MNIKRPFAFPTLLATGKKIDIANMTDSFQSYLQDLELKATKTYGVVCFHSDNFSVVDGEYQLIGEGRCYIPYNRVHDCQSIDMAVLFGTQNLIQIGEEKIMGGVCGIYEKIDPTEHAFIHCCDYNNSGNTSEERGYINHTLHFVNI